MARQTKKLQHAKYGDISAVLENLKKHDTIFHCNYEQLAKHLLQNYLPIKNIWQTDFEIIKTEYLKNIDYKKISKSKAAINLMKLIGAKINEETEKALLSETSFYQYICKRFFFIEKVPGEELLKLYLDASMDMKSIDSTLQSVHNQISEIDKRGDTEEIQGTRPVLVYYQSMNKNAKDEIIDFLTNEIKSFALNNCYKGFFFGENMRMPYAYRWNPKNYIPKVPNDLSNKFGDLILTEFHELNKLYETNKKQFDKKVTEYIKNHDIVNQLKSMLQKHHILFVKKDIIEEAIKTYLKGSKTMFVNACPTIIEGIFHDICILIGIKENDLLQEGFQQKVTRLKGVMSHNLHYEYYVFRFRLVRNKIAHGRMTNEDVKKYADFMLLDLFDACKMVFVERVELNKKLELIKSIDNVPGNAKNPLILKYLLLNNVSIPDFYNLKPNMDSINDWIRDKPFWDYLDKQIEKGEEYVHGVLFILKVLRKLQIHDAFCTDLMKKIAISDVNHEMKEHYFKYLL